MVKEALDAVRGERPFAAVHILATALLCAAGATEDELALARRILERDPKVDAPREAESIAGAFNRHMDAAIDSVNDSVSEPTRAGRRARLAQDLHRAGLVLIDRSQVADMIAVIHELRGRVAELEALEGQDLGAELVDGEPLALPPPGTYGRVKGYGSPLSTAETAETATLVNMLPGGLTYDAIDDRGRIKPAVEKAIAEARAGGLGVSFVHGDGSVEHVPVGEFFEGGERGASRFVDDECQCASCRAAAQRAYEPASTVTAEAPIRFDFADGSSLEFVDDGESYSGIEGADRSAESNPSVND